MQSCDTVFFLDYPAELCLAGIKERKGKARADMPWIGNFNTQSRPCVLDLLSKYSDKEIHIFQNRSSADAFLAECNKK